VPRSRRRTHKVRFSIVYADLYRDGGPAPRRDIDTTRLSHLYVKESTPSARNSEERLELRGWGAVRTNSRFDQSFSREGLPAPATEPRELDAGNGRLEYFGPKAPISKQGV